MRLFRVFPELCSSLLCTYGTLFLFVWIPYPVCNCTTPPSEFGPTLIVWIGFLETVVCGNLCFFVFGKGCWLIDGRCRTFNRLFKFYKFKGGCNHLITFKINTFKLFCSIAIHRCIFVTTIELRYPVILIERYQLYAKSGDIISVLFIISQCSISSSQNFPLPGW